MKITLGAMLRVARRLQAMTQTEFAKAAGVPRATVSKLERDQAFLDREGAEKIVGALKIDMAVVIGVIFGPNWEV